MRWQARPRRFRSRARPSKRAERRYGTRCGAGARPRRVVFYDQEARDAFLARASMLSYRQKVNKAVGGDLQRFDLNPELPKFRFPTLVVTGRYDFNVAPSVAWAIHRAIPGFELAVFEKSGHLPFCEESDAFVARLEAFLLRR